MGNFNQIVIWDIDPLAQEICDFLQRRRINANLIACQTESWAALNPDLIQTIIIPTDQFQLIRDVRQWRDHAAFNTPLLVAYPGADINFTAFEEVKNEVDDVLIWPAGKDQLERRLQRLARQKNKTEELHLRQDYGRIMQEWAAVMASAVNFEDSLIDMLVNLSESIGAQSAKILVTDGISDLFFLIGNSDDATGQRLPVSTSDYPEVNEAIKTKRECIIQANESEPGRIHILESLARRNLASLWAFPLIFDSRAYGVLEFCFVKPTQLSDPAREIFHQICACVANNLYASDLFASLKEQTQKKLLTDIEEQRQSETLKKYEEFFQRAFDGIIVLDRHYRVLYLNPAGEQITGYASRGLINNSLMDIVSETDRRLLTGILEEVKDQGTACSFDLSLITTSGDPVVVSVSPSAVLVDNALIVLSFRDVTEARTLENELRTTKEFLERLIDSTVDAIVATDVDGRIILFNKGAERIFCFSSVDVVGKFLLKDLFPEGMAEKMMEHLRSVEDGGCGRLEAVRKEVLNAHHELVPVQLSANLIYENGCEVGSVGIYSDLRERLRIENTLAQAQEKLVESEKQALIAELAGTTAHELNQPLTSVMGYAELLKRRISSDDSNFRAVETILYEAERMAEIVRKIGKITRYETKTYVGETQILDLEKSSE